MERSPTIAQPVTAAGFRDDAVPQAIASTYGDRVLRLTPARKQACAANATTLADNRVWMNAAASLCDDQRDTLTQWGFRLGAVDWPGIEQAGGSLRCCVGEIH